MTNAFTGELLPTASSDQTLAPLDHDELAHAQNWTPADVSAWTDADYHLTERTRQKLRDSVPAETRRAYERWWQIAADWCTATGRVPLPMHTNTLTEFIRELTDTVSDVTGNLYSVAALDQALAAIRRIHTMAGFDGAPGTTEARQLINAHGKSLKRRGRKSAVMDKVEQWLEVLALDDCDPTTLEGLRNRVMVVISLNLWTRRSELAAMDLSEITEYDDEFEEELPGGQIVTVVRPCLDVFFPSSKTDQKGEGVTVTVVGRDDALCPVTVIRQWRAVLAEHGITDGKLLRSIDRWGNIRPSISGDGINLLTYQLLKQTPYLRDRNGLVFTAHGWRASAYTVAKAAGATDEELHKAGRWSAKSQAAKGYGRSRDNRGRAMRRIRVAQPAAELVPLADLCRPGTGWTQALAFELLGQADEFTQDATGITALYDRSRITAAETTAEFAVRRTRSEEDPGS